MAKEIIIETAQGLKKLLTEELGEVLPGYYQEIQAIAKDLDDIYIDSKIQEARDCCG